jgi:Flp pilus assembly pilin Flp
MRIWRDKAGAISIGCGLIAVVISATVGLALTILGTNRNVACRFFTFAELFDAPAREVGSRT